ncbi:hypothetical protein EDB89DRAFT_1969740 [Lactarius sanguifluus]|nr:hypothetical protein EDB89DRAFT_1969740 [Lactarius sanguifluus]
MDTQSDRHSPVSLLSCSEPLLSIGSPSVRPLSDSSSGTTSHTRKFLRVIARNSRTKARIIQRQLALCLDLKILCTYGTPVRKNLGIWPAFPIIIRYSSHMILMTRNDEDNIISALEHRDRVCDVSLDVLRSSRLEFFFHNDAGAISGTGASLYSHDV